MSAQPELIILGSLPDVNLAASLCNNNFVEKKNKNTSANIVINAEALTEFGGVIS